jgi:DNA-binding beta-propeller fold protein YncE
MKRLTFLMFLMFVCVLAVSAAYDFGVFVNSNTNNIQFIDPESQTVSSPKLAGLLGSYGGGLFDVVITPDKKTIVVSNFGDSKIFFISIDNIFGEPTVVKALRIGFFAEDMAITPDGKYLLVTDGGFSPRVAVIDMSCYNFLKSNNLGTNRYANAVDITPDSKTAVFVDYFQGRAYSYSLQNDGSLVYINTAWVLPCRPVNVTISPDGHTAILASAGNSVCVALAIDDTGLIYGTESVPMPFKSGQSCVFNKAGDKAYYLSNSQNNGTKIVELLITGPGQVTASGNTISCYPPKGTSQLFGVDTIALDPSGNYLYVANPTLSGGLQGIDILDLTTYTRIGYVVGNGIPTGIAFTSSDGGDGE